MVLALLVLALTAIELFLWGGPLRDQVVEQVGGLDAIAERLHLGSPPAPFCDSGQQPRFLLGFGALKTAVGEPMGEPVECEHTNPDTGDVQQRTTTGLAYYRPSLNLAMFTNGEEHWAVTDEGLVRWSGDSAVPTDDASIVPP
jgi:hypothetical protein